MNKFEMKEYIVCAEYYADDSVDGPVLNNGNLEDIVNGYMLFCVKCMELDRNNVEHYARETIKASITNSEYIKQTFPKFYKLSLTKQYWYHIFEQGFIERNNKKESPFDENEVSLEKHLEMSKSLDDGLIDQFEIFLDKDLNRIDGPPGRIDFMDMYGLDDLRLT